MKYIIFEDDSAILFSEGLDHKAMAKNSPVRSAGFCTIETYRNDFDDIRAKVICYGESLSLHKTANEGDDKIIKTLWF